MNYCDMCYPCRVNLRSYSSAEISKLLAPPKYDRFLLNLKLGHVTLARIPKKGHLTFSFFKCNNNGL